VSKTLHELLDDTMVALCDAEARRDQAIAQVLTLTEVAQKLKDALGVDGPEPKAEPKAEVREKKKQQQPSNQWHTCPECGREFSRPQGLSRHLRETHGITKEKPKVSDDAAKAAEHVLSVVPPIVDKPEPKEPKPEVSEVEIVIEVPDDRLALRCNDCPSAFTRLESLVDHVAIQHRRSLNRTERRPREAHEVM
jgi:uncharacterized C2H2 Zn-finger protein